MRAKNIHWDFDDDDLLETLDDISNADISEISGIPLKTLENLYDDEEMLTASLRQCGNNVVNELMTLPSEVDITEEAYTEFRTYKKYNLTNGEIHCWLKNEKFPSSYDDSWIDSFVDDVCDWLSNEYGFCISSFELEEDNETDDNGVVVFA